jgi:hypothetical protein
MITLPYLSILFNALSTVINPNIGALMGYSDYLKMCLRASSSAHPFSYSITLPPAWGLRVLGNLDPLDRRDMINAAISLTQLIYEGG